MGDQSWDEMLSMAMGAVVDRDESSPGPTVAITELIIPRETYS
jgi:hypothetical protein